MPDELTVPLLLDYSLAPDGKPVVNPQKMAKQITKLAMQKMKLKHKSPLTHRKVRRDKQRWY